LIRIEIDPFPAEDELAPLWQAAWGSALGSGYVDSVLTRSLLHLGAYEGERLIGFVNVAWDGGGHAFLLDTTVHPAFQRQGIAVSLVRRAAELAVERGAEWLHVDFEPHLEGFYAACGFRPTGAGLIKLK
jgi:ribosomal protein S18 acetylase RimI-like enzyme